MINYIFLFLIIDFILVSIRKKTTRCENIAHACGSIHSNSLTNSLEAFYNSYSHGYRNIEIDLLVSKDNHIFGAHDWSRFKMFTFYKKNDIINYSYIKKAKLLNKYHIIYDNMINHLFEKFRDVNIYIDKITNYPLLKKFINKNDRLYIEVFNYDEYNLAKKMGYNNILLSIKTKNDLNELINNNNHSVAGITVNRNIFLSQKLNLLKLFQKKLRIYAYDISNHSEIKLSFCKYVNGFYID